MNNSYNFVEEVFAIDPSINRCGWCKMSRDYKILQFGLIKSDSKSGWFMRAQEVANKILEKSYKSSDKVLLEIPEHWSNSVGLAARESGSLFKLTFVCGIIYGKLQNVELFSPTKWKGQLSKEIVTKRLIEKFGRRIQHAEDHNVFDAIGIAYSYFNNWKIL